MKKVIVIGGGAAGLGAAFKVRRAAGEGMDVDCVLLERADRLGGKLASDIVRDDEGREYVVDAGSDSFVSGKPAIGRIARMVGLADEMVPAREENKKTLIVKGKRLIELPDGIMMFAPTKLIPLATTALYSWPAKFRMALDWFLPPKVRWAAGETAQDHDETLESFVVRRMGREALDRLAEPLVGGVHASDPREMSLAATFPNFLEMEQQFGSLIRGFLAERKKREAMRKKYPPRPGAKPWAFFNTFLRGMQTLTDGMADAVGRERIRTGAGVAAIDRSGAGWQVRLESGEVFDADAVIVATEGWAASALVRPVEPAIADLLDAIPYSSSATVPMAFRVADCPFDRKWFGILSPMIERRPLLAVTLSSSKWPDRCPDDAVLLRGFIGGPGNQHLLEASDEELIETVRRQLIDLLGMPQGVRPLFASVYRFNGGMPQYTLGHLDRVDAIEQRSEAVTGFALAGGAFRGVGVPNCIESGERAASKVLGDLGFGPLAEDSAPATREQ